jgi:hypothetical protein
LIGLCVIPNCRPPRRRIGYIPLQLGHAVQIATWSPAAVSQKREYFNYLPETIGDLSLEVTKFGVWRQTAIRKSPPLAGIYSIAEGKSPNTGLVGWSERIRTHAFPIEPGLCVSFLIFGNIRAVTARQKRFKPQKQRVKRCSRIILRSALTMEQARRSERPK